MALQDDINTIKQMQADYFVQHNDYFETDNSKVVPIPSVGGNTKLTRFTKFKSNKDKTPSIDKIPFTPVEKDYKFTVGQIVFVNSAEGGYEAGVEKRAYMIIAERKRPNGDIERTTQYGGDQFVIDTFTDGDSQEGIPSMGAGK